MLVQVLLWIAAAGAVGWVIGRLGHHTAIARGGGLLLGAAWVDGFYTETDIVPGVAVLFMTVVAIVAYQVGQESNPQSPHFKDRRKVKQR